MSAAPPSKRSRIFLLEDVVKHNKPKDCYVVHDNKVYDVRSLPSLPALR